MGYEYGDTMRKFVSMSTTEQRQWMIDNPDEAISLLYYFGGDMERLSAQGLGI